VKFKKNSSKRNSSNRNPEGPRTMKRSSISFVIEETQKV
jgi:hypothetical protein